MDYITEQNETRSNAEQSETGDDLRVSYESEREWTGIVAPELPVGSPERAALFAEFRKTFREDWAAAEEAVEWERRAKYGDLYFVSAGNAIKIGRSTNFGKRLSHIQAHNHEPVECLLLLQGGGWRERSLHRRFRAHRLRGEWFERCPEIEAEIERLNA